MGNKYKFGEESKLISFRVPKSKDKEYRKAIQKFINNGLKTNGIDYKSHLEFLSDLLTSGKYELKSEYTPEEMERILEIEEVLGK